MMFKLYIYVYVMTRNKYRSVVYAFGLVNCRAYARVSRDGTGKGIVVIKETDEGTKRRNEQARWVVPPRCLWGTASAGPV